MPDPTTRRGWLLAAIQDTNGQWTTQRAELALAASPFSCHRNTARKDLRALSRLGALAAVDADGRRIYLPTSSGRGA